METRYEVVEGVAIEEVEEGLLARDREDKHVLLLDPIARDVLRALGRGSTVSAVVARLADQYRGESTEIERDVRELLERLLEWGVVRESGA